MAAGRGRGRRKRRGRRTQRQDRAAAIALILLVAAVLLVLAAEFRARWPRPVPPKPPRPHLTMAQARALNAALPFARGPVAPAAPFVFHGSPAARLQATQCLATVALYEAGDDPRGQRAVMQVVLNRVRAAGFAKTVCGVVYQGAGLPTGCQFSFACDGSVLRRPETEGWAAVRARAGHALAGAVFAPVGTATHYHADWMVPYWIGGLDKIARVHDHLFYRSRPHGAG